MDDRPEKERIALRKSAIFFLFMLSIDSFIDGKENSIKPLNRNAELFVIILFIMLQGIENIIIIPKMLTKVLKA